jgi:predicted metallopeptidase
MAKTTFSPAEEVKEIAEELIPKYHQHLIDNNVRIDYVFISKTPAKGGKEVWGTCRKVTNLNAHLAGEDEPFFVITISEPVWSVLPPDKKVALVDHELCHAFAALGEGEDDSEEVKVSIIPHDVEEFAAVIRRHGLWREDVKNFVEEALSKKDK